MAEVRTTFTSDDKEVQKSLASMQKAMQAITEENRKLKEGAKGAGEALKDEGNEGARAFAGMADHVKSVATGLFSATTAAALFAAEITNIKKLQQDAATAQRDVAALQRSAYNNMPGMTPSQMGRFNAGIASVAESEKVSQALLWGAAPGARSATTSSDQTMANLKVAARYHPTNAGDLEAFAASIGAMEKATGWTGDEGAEANAGVAYRIQGESFVPSADAVKKYLVKGAGKLRSFGDSVGEAATLMPAATHLLSDAEGANSLTFMSNLAAQLQTAMPAEQSTFARIQAMQNDPIARAKFLEKGQFGQDKVFVEKALTDGSEFDRMIESGVRGKWDQESMRAFSASQFANMDAQPLQHAEKFSRTLEANTENTLLADLKSGDAGRLQDALGQLRHKHGMSAISNMWSGTLDSARMMMGEDPSEVAISSLQRWRSVEAEKQIAGKGVKDTFGIGDGGAAAGKLVNTLDALVGEMRTMNNRKINVDGNAE